MNGPGTTLSSRPSRFHTTVTERHSFRTCRRRWYLEVYDRLQPKAQVTWYLIFGDCMHEAMDAYYRPKTSRSFKPPRDIALAMSAFEEAWEEKDQMLRAEYGGFYSLGIDEEWAMHRDRGLEMLKYYHTFDKVHPFFDKVIAVGVEERAFIDILGPGEAHLEGLPLLSGRIDLVVEKENGVWIVDHKALASAPSDKALDLDDQLTAYCYIWARLTGTPPRGAYYNVLIKDPPKQPRMLKNGTLSMDKSQRTTYELYSQALKDMGVKVGVKGAKQFGVEGVVLADYEEMLTYLQDKGWNQFFQRLGPVAKNWEQLEMFERYLYAEHLDMEAALNDVELRYPSGSQYTCPGCAMQPICQTMNSQGNVDLVIRSGYSVLPPRVNVPEEILSDKWEGV